jgi:hypothetical protein
MTNNKNEMVPFTMTYEPTFCVFSAKRRSGKSHLITMMMYKFISHFDMVYVFNPTAFNGHYKKYTPNVYENWDDEKIEKLLKRQAALTGKKKRNRVLLICDDCLSKANFNSKVFEQIATQGRHYQVSCWISTQHYAKIPQPLRLNVDYMLIMGNQKVEVLKRVYDELAGYFDSEKEFITCVKDNLNDYGCFLLNNIDGTWSVIRAPAELPKFYLAAKKQADN